jgi:hypothetical protein
MHHCVWSIALFTLAALCVPVTATPLDPLQVVGRAQTGKMLAFDGLASNAYGVGVAVNSNYLIVGANAASATSPTGKYANTLLTALLLCYCIVRFY